MTNFSILSYHGSREQNNWLAQSYTDKLHYDIGKAKPLSNRPTAPVSQSGIPPSPRLCHTGRKSQHPDPRGLRVKHSKEPTPTKADRARVSTPPTTHRNRHKMKNINHIHFQRHLSHTTIADKKPSHQNLDSTIFPVYANTTVSGT